MLPDGVGSSSDVRTVEYDQDWLTVTYEDGASQRYFATWLRDNVAGGRHQKRGQRTFDINLLDGVSIVGAEHADAQIVVQLGSKESGTASYRFEASWLRQASMSTPTASGRTLWSSNLQESSVFVDYSTAGGDPVVLRKLLAHVDRFGFGLLENVPCEPGTILDVVGLFGYVRDTNYGPLFDVRVEPNPANLAFTSGTIGMHTDNPYRDPVPGLQLLHCLVNDSDGGESQLVDGFAVAERLRSEHPDAFKTLTSTPVEFRFVEAEGKPVNGSVDLWHRTPLISMMGDTITEIRYNSRSIQAFDLPPDEMVAFYEAYRILGQALHESSARIEFRLKPGQLMIFDNQRVLHGRSSYEEGSRHLQGCYADKDSLTSKLRVLQAHSSGGAVR